MWMLENRISANNPSVPLNICSKSKSSQEEVIWQEILQCIQVYYDLIDDWADFPPLATQDEERPLQHSFVPRTDN